MQVELLKRQDSSRVSRSKSVCFPFMRTLDEFDYKRLEHVSEVFIWELAGCNFVGDRQNIVMIDNPGSGKTHLRIALGIEVCQNGFKVRFYTVANLANALAEAIQSHQVSKM